MLRAVFVDLHRYRIRDIFWEGGDYSYAFDSLVDPHDMGTQRYVVEVDGFRFDVLVTCGTADETRAWRFTRQEHMSFYSPAVILGNESFLHYFSSEYTDDCPLAAAEIFKKINWVKAKVDTSEGYKVTEFAWQVDYSEVEL